MGLFITVHGNMKSPKDTTGGIQTPLWRYEHRSEHRRLMHAARKSRLAYSKGSSLPPVSQSHCAMKALRNSQRSFASLTNDAQCGLHHLLSR